MSLFPEWRGGGAWGYFTDPENSLFIVYAPAQEVVARRKFEAEGIELKFV